MVKVVRTEGVWDRVGKFTKKVGEQIGKGVDAYKEAERRRSEAQDRKLDERIKNLDKVYKIKKREEQIDRIEKRLKPTIKPQIGSSESFFGSIGNDKKERKGFF